MIDCPYNCGGFRKDLGILVCRPTGVLVPDLVTNSTVCTKCLDDSNLLSADRYYDLTGITAIRVDFESARCMCMATEGFQKAEHPVKACYLVTNPALFGTIQLYQYQSITKDWGISVHVSYDLQELAAVLGVEASKLAS